MANKESKEVAQFVVTLVNGVSGAMKDGKLDLFDAMGLIKVIMAAGPAVNNIGGVLGEMRSWNGAERNEVFAILNGIDLPDDQKEAYIEKALKAGILLAEVVLPFLKV
jgi:hypothetical protein